MITYPAVKPLLSAEIRARTGMPVDFSLVTAAIGGGSFRAGTAVLWVPVGSHDWDWYEQEAQFKHSEQMLKNSRG